MAHMNEVSVPQMARPERTLLAAKIRLPRKLNPQVVSVELVTFYSSDFILLTAWGLLIRRNEMRTVL